MEKQTEYQAESEKQKVTYDELGKDYPNPLFNRSMSDEDRILYKPIDLFDLMGHMKNMEASAAMHNSGFKFSDAIKALELLEYSRRTDIMVDDSIRKAKALSQLSQSFEKLSKEISKFNQNYKSANESLHEILEKMQLDKLSQALGYTEDLAAEQPIPYALISIADAINELNSTA